MKVLSLIALIGVATAVDCTDDNVVAKQKLQKVAEEAVAANKKLSEAEADADKKKVITDKAAGLAKELETANNNVTIAISSCTPGDAAPAPVDAQSQLQKSNNAKAVGDLKTWGDLQTNEKKQTAKYDAMDAEAKKAWDLKNDASIKKAGERDASEKLANGFVKMSVEQQTIYMAKLLDWKKDIYKKCSADPKDPVCVNAHALREKAEKQRTTDGYYKKTKEDRTKADAAQQEQAKQDLSDITAAAKPVVKPVVKSGLATGGACAKGPDGTRPACQEGACCGLLKKGFMGGSKEQCHPKEKTSVTIKVNDVDESWNMTCITGAKKFTAGIASVLVASYMMA